MKYSTARQGRIFVIRLEDGDIVHEEIEKLARSEGISAGALIILGGADEGSRLVSGPRESRSKPVVPLEAVLDGVHEVEGTGTLFPDEDGNPALHMHMAFGRLGEPNRTGCIRTGVRVWHVMEAVLVELLDSTAVRRLDDATGFALLDP